MTAKIAHKVPSKNNAQPIPNVFARIKFSSSTTYAFILTMGAG